MTKQDPNITEAILSLSSPDRNERVRALRIVLSHPSTETTSAMLTALSDPKRRVRELAVRRCGPFLSSPAIVEQLRKMLEDPKEKPKIRRCALSALMGATPTTTETSPPVAVDAIQEILASDAYRAQILIGVLQMDLNETSTTLLQSFVQNGSKDEAVAATRALCGYKVVNLGSIRDPAQRKRVAATCDRALGEVFYWVKREESAH
jgi:HEAT repeat protein